MSILRGLHMGDRKVKKRLIIWCGIAAALVWVLYVQAGYRQSKAEQLHLKQLRDAYQKTAGQHINVEMSYVTLDSSAVTPVEVSSGTHLKWNKNNELTGNISRENEYYRNGVMERWRKVGFMGFELISSYDEVFDGSHSLIFISSNGLDEADASAGRAQHKQTARGVVERGHGPVELWGRVDEIVLEDVLDSPQVKVLPDPEMVNGLRAYHVIAPLKINLQPNSVHYWLSPERGGLVVRAEIYNSHGRMVRRLDVAEFEELSGGRWIPVKSTYHLYNIDEQGVNAESQRRNTIATVIENPPVSSDEKFFSTAVDSLPAGTVVRDITARTTLIAGEGEADENE